jgi:hypothetical protein
VTTTTNHGTLLTTEILGLQSAMLDDLENVRKGGGSRHGALTGLTVDSRPWKPDKDGETRVYGLPFDDPHAMLFRDVVAGVASLEDKAVTNLEKAMKAHPLGPWIKKQRGLGFKQAGRLLAATGDPYWRRELTYFLADGETVDRTVPEGPRTVSALWAYSGLHVLPGTGQAVDDAHDSLVSAGAEIAGGDPGQSNTATQDWSAGVAARRKKGVKANWSTEAKTRAYLCAESCVKQLLKTCYVDSDDGQRTVAHVDDCKCSPFRRKYDARKFHTSVSRPEWTDGHRHNDALRVASKEILKALWIEARRLHAEADPVLAKMLGESVDIAAPGGQPAR